MCAEKIDHRPEPDLVPIPENRVLDPSPLRTQGQNALNTDDLENFDHADLKEVDTLAEDKTGETTIIQAANVFQSAQADPAHPNPISNSGKLTKVVIGIYPKQLLQPYVIEIRPPGILKVTPRAAASHALLFLHRRHFFAPKTLAHRAALFLLTSLTALDPLAIATLL